MSATKKRIPILTLRDFLWLTLFVASVTMWVLEWHRARRLGSVRLASILHHIAQQPSDQELKRRAALARFQSYSNAKLDRHLWDVRYADWEQFWSEYEPCLLEMARRKMVDELAEHYRSLLAESVGKSIYERPHNLEILTALRRAEGKPDPLKVTLFIHDSNRTAGVEKGAFVTTQLQNVDAAQEPVVLWQFGRDWSQWAFTLTDEQGDQVTPLRSLKLSGGMGAHTPFLVGQIRCGDVLDLRRYLISPKPGRYYLQAYYRNDLPMRSDEIETRVVAKSDPIPVEVKNPDFGRTWAAASTPPPLAVFIACVVMALTSVKRSSTSPATRLSLGISRRDFRWGLLLLLIGLAMCATLPDTRDYDNTALDLAANWTIRPVHD